MLHNPSNLYAGNAVTVDSSPSVRFAAQLMAHRQAKKDALDQYYSKLQANVGANEDKMRPIDIEEGWGQKLNDLQTFYLNPDNKRNILKPSADGYKTINRYNSMYNDLIKDARASKNRLEQEKLVNVHRLSGRWNPTDSDMDETHALSRSIYDPSRIITEPDPTSGLPISREPSVNYLSVNVPAFDAQKESQFSKSVIGQAKTGKAYDESKARIDKSTGEIFLPFKESYTPETIKSIADNAGKLATIKNTPASVYYEHLKEDPTFISTATPIYQSVYGKTNLDGSENVIDTPSKAAQAEYIVKASQAGKEGEDKVTDWQTKQRLSQKFAIEQQKRGADFAMDRVLTMLNTKRTLENEDDFKGIASIFNNTKNMIDNGKPVVGMLGETHPELVEVSDIDLLNAASKIKEAPINRVTFDKNKDQFNIEYDGWQGHDKDGKPTVFHPAETVPISRQDYLRIKVDKMNPKNKGKTNANIDKIITENGGLYPALQKVFAPDAVNKGRSKVTTSETKTQLLKPQSRKGKDGKTYTSRDGKTWTAEDGTTVILK